jgi:hypothetical protein
MTRSVLARLLLVVALLAGWQAALVHPLDHVDSHGQLVHVGDGHAKDGDSSSNDPAAKLCDALGALTAVAPQASAAFTHESAELAVAARIAVAALPAEAVPFLSQGPPQLL